MSSWMNLIKETFINGREDHQIYHQWFGMPYIYVIRHWKCTCYYLKNLQCYLCLLLNNIQEGGAHALKGFNPFMKKLLFCWLYFDDKWNVFAKICTVSTRRVCRGRKFVERFFTFMVVGLKGSITFVVLTIPGVTVNGLWLTEKISDNINNLIEIGLCVQGIVTDNISYKV